MARTPRITAEMLLEAGAAITLEKGADALNVRSVAAKLNCSVQPVFRNFGSMETFRRAVIEYLDGTYQSFVAQYLDKSDYLFTISLAHILLARDRRNLFGVLFLSNEYGSRTVPQIISSPWNREAIDCTAVQYGLTVKEPKPFIATCDFIHSASPKRCMRARLSRRKMSCGSCCAAPSANSAQNNAVFSFKEFGEKTWSLTHKTKKNIWKT